MSARASLIVLLSMWAVVPSALAQTWRVVSEDTSAVRLGPPIPLARPTASETQPRLFSLEEMEVFRRPAQQYTTLRTRLADPQVQPASGFGGAALPNEEQYNCGVITEGPIAGQVPSHPFRDFWDRLFGRSPNAGCGGHPWLQGHPWFQAGPTSWFSFMPDREFDFFISPLSNPYFFEDPRSLTEFRPIIIWQKSSSSNPLFRGGDALFFTFQGRLALNERWSIVIHKFGFAHVSPDGQDDPLNPNPFAGGTGLTDLQIGPKWTFYRDLQSRTIAAVGVNFEIPTGSSRVLQGNSGAVTPYISAAQALGNFNLMGATGYRFGFSNSRSDMFFLSLHADYNIANKFFPLAELNWYYYTKNGTSLAANFEGADLYNFGADAIAGRSLLTLNLGARYKFSEALQLGAGYEFPVVGKANGVMNWRLTFDLIWRF